MTPELRSRAPFELLRFTVAPVVGDLAVIELEGRFAQRGRFARRPMLVVEDGGDGPRLELAPVWSAIDDDGRWRSAYAVPAAVAAGGARFALGLRGTLLDLPAPDDPGDADRLTAIAREANGLRRALEAAEDEVASVRADAAGSAAELGAAVLAARDEARAESAERVEALEREVAAAHRAAAEVTAKARSEAEAAQAAAVAASDERHEQAVAEAVAGAQAAEQRAEAAEARARTAEQAAEVARERARVDEAGIDVLRTELAEERERSQATIAALEDELHAGQTATAVVAPVRDEPDPDPDPADAGHAAADPAGHADPDPAGHAAADLDPAGDDTDDTHILDPLSPASTGTGAAAAEVTHHGPGLSRWVAVGALVLFAFVLLGLLLGFLG